MLLIALGGLLISLSIIAALVLFFYFIIKTAVKNGVLEAYSIIKDKKDKM